jgi:hypothetical protein
VVGADDDVLDRCRHGRLASNFCPSCDREEVGTEARIPPATDLDLRDQPDVDLREPEHRAPRKPPS